MLRREDGNARILLPLCFFYSKRELSNEYLLAKIGFDTTEKVLFEDGQLMVYLLCFIFERALRMLARRSQICNISKQNATAPSLPTHLPSLPLDDRALDTLEVPLIGHGIAFIQRLIVSHIHGCEWHADSVLYRFHHSVGKFFAIEAQEFQKGTSINRCH